MRRFTETWTFPRVKAIGTSSDGTLLCHFIDSAGSIAFEERVPLSQIDQRSKVRTLGDKGSLTTSTSWAERLSDEKRALAGGITRQSRTPNNTNEPGEWSISTLREFSPLVAESTRETFGLLIESLRSVEENPSTFLEYRDHVFQAGAGDVQEYVARVLDAAFSVGVIAECGSVLLDVSTELRKADIGLADDVAVAAVEALERAIRSLQTLRMYDLHPEIFIKDGFPVFRIWPEQWQTDLSQKLEESRQVREAEEGEVSRESVDDEQGDDSDTEHAGAGLLHSTQERLQHEGAECLDGILLYAHTERREGNTLVTELAFQAAVKLDSLIDTVETCYLDEADEEEAPDPASEALRSAGWLDMEKLERIRALASWFLTAVPHWKREQVGDALYEVTGDYIEAHKFSFPAPVYAHFEDGGLVITCEGGTVSVVSADKGTSDSDSGTNGLLVDKEVLETLAPGEGHTVLIAWPGSAVYRSFRAIDAKSGRSNIDRVEHELLLRQRRKIWDRVFDTQLAELWQLAHGVQGKSGGTESFAVGHDRDSGAIAIWNTSTSDELAERSDAEPEASSGSVETPPTLGEENLKNLEGLENVKRSLDEIRSLLSIDQERRRLGIPSRRQSLHAVFAGNPGTGKTTVARIYADTLRELGYLKRGHLVEADRSKLVAEYLGQTASKTSRVLQSSLGGVLFIDEAYALKQDKEDMYGQECIDTLLKFMEDHRDELVIILAGYPEQMDELLNTNPGFKSRFVQYLSFDDYTNDQLRAILSQDGCGARLLDCRSGFRSYY